MFLPCDGPWGAWQSEGSLDLTIGRGGDAGEQRYYTCAVETREGKLKGVVWEESREALPGSYDFDHDGEPEIVELVTVYGGEEQSKTGWYGLRVRTADNRLLEPDPPREPSGLGVLFRLPGGGGGLPAPLSPRHVPGICHL